jgi:hypothetical protein
MKLFQMLGRAKWRDVMHTGCCWCGADMDIFGLQSPLDLFHNLVIMHYCLFYNLVHSASGDVPNEPKQQKIDQNLCCAITY